MYTTHFPNLLGFFRRILEAAALKSQIEKKNLYPHYRGRLSMTKVDIDQDDIQLENASKYLIYMEKKISRMISKKEYSEAGKHFDFMLRKSKVFALFILNKVDKDGYYTRSYKNLQTIMSKFNRHARLKEHMLTIHRTYIPKKDGIRVRPLGAPSIEVRLLMASLTEFINIYAENYVGPYQYGFLPKRASYQLGVEIIRRLSEGKRFVEFDLDSFFNRVDYRRVLQELPFEKLAKGILNINTFSIPIPKSKEKYDSPIQLNERGGHSTDMEFKDFGNCAYKQGFTQGANYSPVLCVIALEMAGFGSMNGLLMGADDGLLEINSDLEQNINKLKNAEYGIHLAEDKYFGPCAEKFTFFGGEFDTLKQTVTSGEETRTYRDILVDESVNKSQGNKKFFGKSPKYSGKINYSSGQFQTNKNLGTGQAKFKALLENQGNGTIREESMITLAPTCNFTKPSARQVFVEREKTSYYYDLDKVGNGCNVRMLELLSNLTTGKCVSIKEKYYEGNPIVEIPNLSYLISDGRIIHIKSFPKRLTDYDHSLDEEIPTEVNYLSIYKKAYGDHILEDIKSTSLMYKHKVNYMYVTKTNERLNGHKAGLINNTQVLSSLLDTHNKFIISDKEIYQPIPTEEEVRKILELVSRIDPNEM